jgi:hypothetical protein
MESSQDALAAVAATVGAADVLVFRRGDGTRYRNAGGVGRGAEWAGTAELTLDEEPLVREALAAGAPRRVVRARANRLAGPYYAVDGALVPIDGSELVVVGPQLPHDVGPQELASAAADAACLVAPAPGQGVVSPPLPDLVAGEVATVARQVVELATAQLECELGVLYLPRTTTLASCRRGRPLPEDGELAAVMEGLAADLGRLPLCCQDAGRCPLPAPLGAAAGVRSYLALGIDVPGRAVLLVMHTDAAPRGFTTVCLDRAQRLADAAAPLLRAGLAHQRIYSRRPPA